MKSINHKINIILINYAPNNIVTDPPIEQIHKNLVNQYVID